MYDDETDAAHQALHRIFPALHFEQEPFGVAIEKLTQATGLRFVVKWQTIYKQRSLTSTAHVQYYEGPHSQTLRIVLAVFLQKNLGLDYLAHGETITVSTPADIGVMKEAAIVTAPGVFEVTASATSHMENLTFIGAPPTPKTQSDSGTAEDKAMVEFMNDPDGYSKSWSKLAAKLDIRRQDLSEGKLPRLKALMEGHKQGQRGALRRGTKDADRNVDAFDAAADHAADAED